jgi:Tol biopolymer transport system component
MTSRLLLAATAVAALAAGPIYPAMPQAQGQQPQDQPVRLDPREVHFRNVKQLTFGGENAEAYFSLDGQEIIFQSTRDPYRCDQIFTMNADGSNTKMVSTGRGRVTCGYFTPDKSRIIYASTHLGSPECPMPPNMSEGYVWAVYPTYDIFSANRDGSDIKRLTSTNGYDAEGTISTDGRKIVFTSTRNGDLDLYEMNIDGTGVRQLTNEVGYDGGAWHSQDGQWIVWRANRPGTPADLERYNSLLSRNLVMPSRMELMIMRSDGSDKKQLTSNGGANFAPYFHPNGRQIIFASNLHNPRGGNFDLFMINRDGTGLQQLTFDQNFDGFPMFNADGTKIIWESNRNARVQGETNIFIADWVS